VSLVAGLLDAQRRRQEVDPSPPQSQNLADAQSCHNSKQDNRAHGFIRRSDGSPYLLNCQKTVRTLERTLRHLYAPHGMVREIAPTHRSAENLAQQIAEVVGRLSGEPLLQLVDQVLLNLRTANVTQATVAKARE